MGVARGVLMLVILDKSELVKIGKDNCLALAWDDIL